MKQSLIAGVALFLSVGLQGAVVRPAPEFSVEGVAKGRLRNFRGQTVVLLITKSARDKVFRSEIDDLGHLYGRFSNEKVLFVAAIENGPQDVPSNIPFLIAENPGQVAADYGLTGRFGIAVIGVDGNLDMVTKRKVAAERIRDAVYDNYESQAASRRPLTP